MEQLVNFIIRPPRAEYNPKSDLLDEEFMLKGKWYQRKDLEVTNSRGDVLQCSHYIPMDYSDRKALPCVIYCHGNSGCRADASEAAIILLPSNITVFCLDFSGSGISGGEHVTLGWNEKDDLRAVVDHLRGDGNVSLIALWGRSMGAVTSLLYGAEDPSIAGMVLDSPFSDLVDLMMELVDVYKIRIPKFTVKIAIQYMRRAVLKKAKFDITELNTIKVAKSCFVPVLFGHAIDDDFIQPHHSDRIYSAYVGDKNIIKFEGDHNSPRPQFYFDSICIFFNNVLQPPVDDVSAFFDVSHDYFGKGSWSTIDEVRCSDGLLSATPVDPGASSTEDAIKQLRSRRPMSKTEVPADISSKDETSEAQESRLGNDDVASCSKMISFELANGNPYGPHVPASLDDEDYIEYPLDSLADFPSNAEEEERMLMEAMLESLKDLEATQSCPSEAANGLIELYPNDSQENITEKPGAKEMIAVTMSPTKDGCATIETRSTVVHCLKETGTASASPISDTSYSKETGTCSTSSPVSNPSCPKEIGTNGGSPTSDSTPSNQSITDSDLAERTKATVTVVKNPTGNVLDGFFRRWDLNFFRNR